MIKKICFSLFILILISFHTFNASACSSFAVYGKKTVFGMNFDYERFPIKFIIIENNDLKTFHLAFKRPVGKEEIWACTAGMNNKGLFASCQEEHPFIDNPPEFKSEDIYVHQLYMKINELSSVKEISEICNSKRLVQYKGVSVHNLFADSHKALITEASEKGNVLIENFENYLVMTNFQNRNFHNMNIKDIKGPGAERYIRAKKYIDKNMDDFNFESAMTLLKKINNKKTDYPTTCSMVFDPVKSEIYIAVLRNYEKIFKVSINSKTIETFKGFNKHKKLPIDGKGVLLSDLEKWLDL